MMDVKSRQVKGRRQFESNVEKTVKRIEWVNKSRSIKIKLGKASKIQKHNDHKKACLVTSRAVCLTTSPMVGVRAWELFRMPARFQTQVT